MTLLYGTFIASILGLGTIVAGYSVAGFMAAESRLTRLAIANLTGLAWILFGASVLGALAPLHAPAVWLLWFPVLLVWLVPALRNQLRSDLLATVKSSRFYAAAGGAAVLWVALLLPFLVYPDLVFFDGKTNHDNFFWCVGAEYLQGQSYLTLPLPSREYPLYNLVKAFIGWQPVWGRMGSEGFIAVLSSTVGQPPIQLYNFLVSSLVVPWLLTVLAIAHLMGARPLNRGLLGLVCFSQPILYFFITNGNLPNLLGAIFSGGLWLLLLLSGEARSHTRLLAAAGILFVHAVLCCYPEILSFALIPIALLAGWRLVQGEPRRKKMLLLLALILIGGFCLNPLTTARTWSGMLNSIDQVRQDEKWANVFARLTYAGYVPSLITLAMPSVRLIGLVGGALASVAVLVSCGLLIKDSPRRSVLLFSLSGFAALLLYTVAASFSYGWQKSAQFFGIQLAVLFPVLLAGLFQTTFRTEPRRWLASVALSATLLILVLGTLGNAADNLKSAGTKALTRPMLAWRDRIATEFPGRTVSIDGATFPAAFFHSMWGTELFARNPVVFLSRSGQPAGYLEDSVIVADPTSPPPTALNYVATDWAQAFDYQPAPLLADRVGVLLSQHNLIPELSGFYRPTGVPTGVAAEFSLTVYPYADGWLEFILAPNGQPAPDCRLQGNVTTDAGVQAVAATLDARQHLVVRFPLKAGRRNVLSAQISGAPSLNPARDDPPSPFKVLTVKSGRDPSAN